MDILIPNTWFSVWKIRKNQNQKVEKVKTKTKSSDKNSISFAEILEREVEKYKA